MAYIDPKTNQPVVLKGTLEEQNVAANKAGYDYKADTPASTGATPNTPATDSSAVRRDITAAGGKEAVPAPAFKAPTFEAFKSQIGATATPPPAAPNTLDTYAQLRQSQGISAIEDSVGQFEAEKADLMAAAAKFKLGSTAGYSEATAGARMSEEERNIQDRLDFIGRQEALAQGKLTLKNNYIDTIMKLTKDDYATTRQNYEYEFNKNIQMQNAYSTAMNREMTLDEKQKNDARATISSMWNMAKDTIGRDPGALESFIKTHGNDINQLELIAGEPVGSTEAFLRAKPGATIIAKGTGVNPATGNISSWVQNIGADGQPVITYTDTGVAPRPSSSQQKTKKEESTMNYLESIKGEDNYVDPHVYQELRATSGLSATEFDKKFGQYINPDSYSTVQYKPTGTAPKSKSKKSLSSLTL